ncbi:MAG: tetraacyldisaccharide 4'-kinase, partial [Gemmatimonadota bacterium]|nr:tetraacyldisaccharide 4'-kinase [Gemmatimonadota bacterium]
MVDLKRRLIGVWTSGGAAARTARAALLPFSALYRAVSSARGMLYDRRVLPVYQSSIPVVSVGNLTVGGTGKTPISAWIAREILERGRVPAIVLRGYGADEPGVHAVLNPGVQIVVSADRVHAIARAAAQGADVAVLDDAFQHRRVRREVDLVLVSAERWTARRHLLPAGPWREPITSLARATAAVVTRKSASAEHAASVARALERVIGGEHIASVAFALGDLRSIRGESRPLAAVKNARVLA